MTLRDRVGRLTPALEPGSTVASYYAATISLAMLILQAIRGLEKTLAVLEDREDYRKASEGFNSAMAELRAFGIIERGRVPRSLWEDPSEEVLRREFPSLAKSALARDVLSKVQAAKAAWAELAGLRDESGESVIARVRRTRATIERLSPEGGVEALIRGLSAAQAESPRGKELRKDLPATAGLAKLLRSVPYVKSVMD